MRLPPSALALPEQVGGWTLETFSMWLLKKGRRLRECSQWFKAFDANQDKARGAAGIV